MKYNIYDLGKIINRLQKVYSQLTIEEVPEYTINLIKTLKTRNTPSLDIKVIVNAVVTKDPAHPEIILKDVRAGKDIEKYVKKVYDGVIQ